MLQVHSLAAQRRSRFVFRDLTFTLHAGDVLLVKGSNGSGKSSLLRVLAGLLPLAQGTFVWNDQNDRPPLHYVGHLDAVKPELTAAEMLDYWRTLYSDRTLPIFHDAFGITSFINQPVRYLSAGQKRRLALSRLGLYQAPLWLLDEPTTALDVATQKHLFQIIDKHRMAGGITLVATHQDLDIANAKTLIMGQSQAESMAA